MLRFKQVIAVFIGSVLLAIGVNLFLIPYKLLDGGMIGLGLIFRYFTGLNVGFIIICLSTPIFAFAWFYNKKFFYNSIFGMLISSIAIDLVFTYQIFISFSITLDPFKSAIAGGTLIGLGMGLMLRYNTSTGGTDLIAQLLSKLLNINVGIIIFVIDGIIICVGGWLISAETIILSAITILLVGIFTSICTWDITY